MGLIKAIRLQDIKAIERLLDYGAPVNKVEFKTTPLIEAILTGNIEIVKLLVDRAPPGGADVHSTVYEAFNIAFSYFSHPLIIANGEIFNFLLSKIDINKLEPTVLLKVFEKICGTDDIEMAKQFILFVKDHKFNDDLLFTAARCDGAQIIELLINYSYSINLSYLFSIVISFENIKSLNKLIELRLEIPESALNTNNIEIARILLDHNIDINYQDDKGCTALINAARSSHSNMVDFLIKNNADINIKNNAGESALDLAIKYKDIVSSVLLKHDMIHSKDEQDETYLIRACQSKNEELILFLYENGADFNVRNNKGKSAVDILKRKIKLSDRLTALLEQVILSSTIDDTDENSIGL